MIIKMISLTFLKIQRNIFVRNFKTNEIKYLDNIEGNFI